MPHYYRRLIQLRKQYPALIDGTFLPDNENIVVYIRELTLILHNLSPSAETVTFPPEPRGPMRTCYDAIVRRQTVCRRLY
ncbi:MAG: hypothetical protein OWQ57_10260 [Sulfobacillus sp.]|nr:hypothetical protein [Sulfobacillus sp.]